jgi:Ca-activated chloride channel family protein
MAANGLCRQAAPAQWVRLALAFCVALTLLPTAISSSVRGQQRASLSPPHTPSQTKPAFRTQDAAASPPAQKAPPHKITPVAVATPKTPTPETDAKRLAETVGDDEVVRVESNLVLVPASVVDTQGRAITDLRLDEFELRVDGQLQPISDLGRAETPVLIAMLFDNSASLSAAREFEKKAATRFFQSVMRPIDRAAVYSISTVPTLSQPLTGDIHHLVNTVEGIPHPEGATALFDTVAQAADYLRSFTGRKVIVLVSDGTDTVSDIAFEEALNRVIRSDAQVYVVQTRQVEDANLHDPISAGRLDKLTEQTGGAVYTPRSIADLDAAFTQISLDIGQQYLLSYCPPDERQDKRFRPINLRVKTRPNARVRARKGFYPNRTQNQSAPQANKLNASGEGKAAPLRHHFIEP